MDWNIDPRTSFLAEETRTRNQQAAAARLAAGEAERKAREKAEEAQRAQQKLHQQSTERALDMRAMDKLKKEVETSNGRVKELEEALKQRDSLLLDWMHTSEAFRRLTKQFGDKLAIPKDQVQKELDEQIMDLAEEDPKFQGTAPHKRAQTRAAGGKP